MRHSARRSSTSNDTFLETPSFGERPRKVAVKLDVRGRPGATGLEGHHDTVGKSVGGLPVHHLVLLVFRAVRHEAQGFDVVRARRANTVQDLALDALAVWVASGACIPDESSDGVGVVPQGVARGGRGGDVDGPGELAEDVAVLFGIEPASRIRPPASSRRIPSAARRAPPRGDPDREVAAGDSTGADGVRVAQEVELGALWDERGRRPRSRPHTRGRRGGTRRWRARVGGSGTLTPRGRRREDGGGGGGHVASGGVRRRFGGETPRDTTVGRSRMLTRRARRRTVPRTPSDTPQPHPSPVCFFRVMCLAERALAPACAVIEHEK